MEAPRELIVTHLGADFDAVGSMLAARRMHPGARLFFPGSKEESVRRLLEEEGIELPEVRRRDVVPEALERIILCDIRQCGRIGVVAEWLAERQGLPVVVYDHHTEGDDDVAAGEGVVDPSVGATSTLMVEELKRRGIAPEALERDLLLAGIYEDTGSLAYDTTTPRDMAAAAHLLGLGADLALVRRHAVRSLDREHLEILHAMVRDLEVQRLRGHRIGIVDLELGRYVEELAPLVSRCQEILDLDAVFALFGEGERVSLIARGRVQGCDLGDILAAVSDGGGHATAAAGSLRGVAVLEARERLLSHLEAVLPARGTARELMVKPVATVASGLDVAAAKTELNRLRINAAPVVGEGGRVVGVTTRQQLDAALAHEMGHRPVTDVMEAELAWEVPDAPAERVARRMLEERQRLILVGDVAAGQAEGVVSRMSVLRYLAAEPAPGPEVSAHRQTEIKRRRAGIVELLDGLVEQLRRSIRIVREVAQQTRTPVYLVGGLVRDLHLGRDNRDLDIVVEGDGPAFARRLAERIGGRVRVHEPFMTAVVIDAEGRHIDVATARSEFYRAPAALPEVQTSALRQDLYRRDFTINTLAIRLGPEPRPELIDYFGGLRDIERRTLRVLHSLSFIDDPTRALRAVRLEARLGFTLADETERLLLVALEEGVFGRLSGSRLRDEVRRLLANASTALRALDRLHELGVLGVLHPDLARNEEWRERLRAARAALEWAELEGLELKSLAEWRLLLLALTWDLGPAEMQELTRRWALGRDDAQALTSQRRRLREALRRLQDDTPPSQVAALLGELADDLLLLAMALTGGAARERVRRFLEQDRFLELTITGEDLLQRGVREGPAVGTALEATRAARLDGRITPDEELEFALHEAREWLARHAEAAAGSASPAAPGAVER